jgi:hypothetical protein
MGHKKAPWLLGLSYLSDPSYRFCHNLIGIQKTLYAVHKHHKRESSTRSIFYQLLKKIRQIGQIGQSL